MLESTKLLILNKQTAGKEESDPQGMPKGRQIALTHLF